MNEFQETISLRRGAGFWSKEAMPCHRQGAICDRSCPLRLKVCPQHDTYMENGNKKGQGAMRHASFLVMSCLIFAGCAASAPFGMKKTSAPAFTPEEVIVPPLTMEEVIVPSSAYSTETGRALAIKYETNLQNIFLNIRIKYYPELKFAPISVLNNMASGGIGFFRPSDDKRFLGVQVYLDAPYNKSRTDFNERAATSFSRYARGLLEIIMKEREPLNDGNVSGAFVSLSWIARDFSHSYRGGEWECINIEASRDDVKRFLSDEISNQEFVNRCEIGARMGWNELGKIELDLKETL